jgi:SAM-dependent methyltransferase
MAKYATWLKDEKQEVSMGEQHKPFWQCMINKSVETSLAQKAVLDFGCGTGGFLRTLYSEHPFKAGVGVDLAESSVDMANSNKGSMPLEYYVAGSAPDLSNKFDVAFSYEVIYLMPDLRAHARFIADSLKQNGVYYAATGCHTANPMWEDWKKVIERKSELPCTDYSPEDFVAAFEAEGFTAAGQQLGFDGFVPLNLHPEYYPTTQDSINYYKRDVIIFQFTKK